MGVSQRVFSGAGYLFLGQGGARLLSILTVPILSHLIAPAGYGVAALITTALSLGSVFTLVGIEMSYARLYAAKEPPNGPRIEAFCWRFALINGLIGGLLGAIVWHRLLPLFFPVPIEYAPLVGVGVFLSTTHALAQTRARLQGNFKRLASVLFGAALVGALGALGLAALGVTDERPLLFSLILTITLGIVGLGVPARMLLLRPSGLTLVERRHIVAVGFAGVVTAPAYWLLSSADRWFLTALQGTDIAGVYSVSASVGIAGLVVSQAFLSAWLPEAINEFERAPETAPRHLALLQQRIILVCALVWLLVAMMGPEVIRILAAPIFHSAIGVIPWLAGGIFFYSFFHLANASLLIKKRAGRSVVWWIMGGLISIVLNLVLIPRFGALGAAMAQCFSFAVVGMGSMIAAHRTLPLTIGGPLWLTLCAIGFLGVAAAGAWASNPWMSVLLKLPCLGAVSFIALRILEPALMQDLWALRPRR